MKIPRTMFRQLAIGFAAGPAVSVLPLPLNFLLGLVSIGFWFVRLVRRVPRDAVGYSFSATAGIVTVAVAILLPVKHLDWAVGPIRYEQMSLDDLCQLLSRDYRVFVHPERRAATNIFIAFSTDRAMTRRDVLRKLARDANCDLRIGYCGTGATFLFGAHPSFTRLNPRVAQQDSAADENQSIRSETNRTSLGAGARN